MLTLKYFGRLQELTGRSEESMPAEQNTVAELKAFLEKKYPDLAQASFTVAVDQQIAEETKDISGASEVALLPPFSGG